MPSIHGYSSRLVRKLAADSIPGIVDIASRAGSSNTTAGQSMFGQPRPEFSQATREGTATNAELLTGAGSTIGGELGGGIIGAIMPFLQMTGLVDPGKFNQIGYGSNLKRLEQQSSVVKAIMPERYEQMGRAFPEAVAGIGARAGLKEQGEWLAGQLAGVSDPKSLGMFAAQIFPMLPPEAQGLVTAVAPQVLWDPNPIIQLSYRMSGGKPNPPLASQLMQQFDATLKSGQFGGVPADAAAAAMYKAGQIFGPRFNMQHAVSLTQGADLIVQNTGLRHGDAVELLAGLSPTDTLANAVKDPRKLNTVINSTIQMYNSSGMSPQEFGGIMQAAKQSNVPIGLALRANMHGAHLRRSYDGKGEQYAKAYAEMRMGVGASDNTKLLGAIYSENPDMVRRVLESGNQNALNQMLEGARRSGKMLYNRRTVDMPNFLDKLSTMSPQAFDMLQKYEVKQYADRYQLGGLLKNKQFLADYIADPNTAMGKYRLTGMQRQALTNTGGRLIGSMMVEHAPPPEKFDIQPRTTSYPLSSTNVKPLPDLANAVAKGKEMVGRAVDSAKELVSPGAAPIGK